MHFHVRQTITAAELIKLTACNSRRLPRKCVIGGRVYEWVGIGWLDVGPEPTSGHGGELVWVVEEAK